MHDVDVNQVDSKYCYNHNGYSAITNAYDSDDNVFFIILNEASSDDDDDLVKED